MGDVTEGLFGPGATPSPELVGASLIEGLTESDDPFVLVIDDYQLVTAEPVHRLVRFLIERGPPFVHLVLLTREDPPLPLARLRAHGQLVELRADDLRCTSEETSTCLGDAGISLDPPLVGRLLDRTEGWIAGLQLAAITLRDQPDPAALIGAFHGSHRFVLDYLADEVLGGIDRDFRAFLIKTSIADRFTAELCRELTGRDDSDALLAQAEQTNLFLIPLDAERRWYRYHRLFADYLRSQLGEQERRALHELAANYARSSSRRSAYVRNDELLNADGSGASWSSVSPAAAWRLSTRSVTRLCTVVKLPAARRPRRVLVGWRPTVRRSLP